MELIKQECNVLLVGKTGSGKSSLGNSLLGTTGSDKPFESAIRAEAVTKECTRRRVVLGNGRLLSILDTPGFFDTKTPDDETTNEIIKSLGLLSPGPNVIIFVLTLKRFTREEVHTIDIIKELFGKEAINRVIVVFTGKDGLDPDEDEDIKTVEDFVENGPDYLRDFVKECDGRYVGIANKPSSPTHLDDVKEVMELILKTQEQNGSLVYSIFNELEPLIVDQIKKRRPNSQKSESEIREDIRKEIESNNSGIIETLKKKLKAFIQGLFRNSHTDK